MKFKNIFCCCLSLGLIFGGSTFFASKDKKSKEIQTIKVRYLVPQTGPNGEKILLREISIPNTNWCTPLRKSDEKYVCRVLLKKTDITDSLKTVFTVHFYDLNDLQECSTLMKILNSNDALIVELKHYYRHLKGKTPSYNDDIYISLEEALKIFPKYGIKVCVCMI